MNRLASLVARTEGVQPWRRILHATIGLIIILFLILVDPSWGLAVGVLGGTTLLVLVLDGLRLMIPRLNRFFFRILRPFASPREAQGIASSTWFMLGIFLAVAIFPRSVVIPAILTLSLADPAASYVGRRWGRRPLGSGTVEGSLVFLVVALSILVPVAGLLPGSGTALAVTLAERVPWPLDDNLVIPLLTGILLWSLLPFWG